MGESTLFYLYINEGMTDEHKRTQMAIMTICMEVGA